MAMKARKPEWTITHPDAAGIDVGSASHFVAIPPQRQEQTVREFGCHTADLGQLADWLVASGVKTVAVESTGVYWVGLYEVLQARGLDVWLVNAKSVRHVSGRKSDVLDCQWLQQLHTFGLLQRAFRPTSAVCGLREIVRLRQTQLQERARHVQRMQKALTQMNLQLTNVLSDIVGNSGLAILRAIVQGERDTYKLAALCNYRVRASRDEVAKSLEGTWAFEHLLCLKLELAAFEHASAQLGEIDEHIQTLLKGFAVHEREAKADPNKGRGKNAPKFNLRTALLNWSGVDLTAVPGIDATTAMNVLCELGCTLHEFATAGHFCSWLGLCPGTRITGGKRLSGATKRVPNRVSLALKLAAQGLTRAHCALGGYYRRMALRMGTAKAITAVAHKLARIIYAMLTKSQEFVETDQSAHEQRSQAKRLKTVQRQAAQMGFDLVPKTCPIAV